MRGKQVSGKAMLILCIASFFAGSLFSTTSRTWSSTSTSLYGDDDQPNGGHEAHPFPIVPKHHIHNHLNEKAKSKGAAALVLTQTNCNDDHKRVRNISFLSICFEHVTKAPYYIKILN